MGRWAQAQRRGSVGGAGPPPPIDCANVVLDVQNVGGNTEYKIASVAGGIPPGVTGLAWQAGAADCTETDGTVLLSALPTPVILTVPGEDVDGFFQFAWVVGDSIQSFGCDCTPFGP